VLDEDPDKSDMRMYHEAMEVIKGAKYAANHWSEFCAMSDLIFALLDDYAILTPYLSYEYHKVHQYDFRTANKWGCNGSFG